LSYRDPGNKIKITYRRGTVLKEAIVLLTNLEGNTKLTKREVTNNDWMKASISPLSKSEKTKLNVSSGVRVVKMETESVMRRLNIKEGQIIVAIDYQPVNNDEELEAALKKARGRIVLDIVENNGQRYQIQHLIQ